MERENVVPRHDAAKRAEFYRVRMLRGIQRHGARTDADRALLKEESDRAAAALAEQEPAEEVVTEQPSSLPAEEVPSSPAQASQGPMSLLPGEASKLSLEPHG